jgi:hypothetical protein
MHIIHVVPWEAEIEGGGWEWTAVHVLIWFLRLSGPQVAIDVRWIGAQHALRMGRIRSPLLPNKTIRRQGFTVDLMSTAYTGEYILSFHCMIEARFSHVPGEGTCVVG